MSKNSHGFSIIEVLIALVIVISGISAILTLQVRTLSSVGTSRNIAEATNLAEHFIETVKIEAMEWQNNGSLSYNQTGFKYLSNAGTGWKAAYLKNGSPLMVGQNGNDNDIATGYDSGILQAIPVIPQKFCVFYRLTSLLSDNSAMRLEVRVLFRTTDGSWPNGYKQCNPTNMTAMVRDLANTSMVNMVTVVSMNRVL